VNPVRSLLLAASTNPWLARQATRRRFIRRAVSRFMPGETMEEAVAAAAALATRGLSSILTHLGENVSDQAEARSVVRHYLELLDRVESAKLDADLSVKLTQLGLDLDPDLALEHARSIAERSAARGNRLWIDMEGSAYTEATLDLYRRLRADHDHVGVCLQAYFPRTRQDLESLLPLAPAIRIVKGAYREAPELVFARKPDVDANFFALCARVLELSARRSGAWLAVGTHDGKLIRAIEAHVAANGVARDAFEFAMLYGIQRAEQERLARAGYRTRVLISYGPHWFPWYMRRLAERPANMWFVVRNLWSG